MNKVEIIMDYVAKHMIKIIFTIIIIAALFIKAMYHISDYPYFTKHTIFDFSMGILALAFYIILYKYKDVIQKELNYKICFIFFMLASLAYVLLVPLTPFSDMRAVYQGAINFANIDFDAFFNDDYWSIFPGNIKLAVFWGVLLLPLPKHLLTLKVINAIFLYITVALTREIAKAYGIKNYKLVYIAMLTFTPLFLYINHVYFDIPVIMLCTLAVYIFMRYHNIVLSCFVLGIARYLRQNVMVFIAALIIIYVFNSIDIVSNKEKIKKWLLLLVGVLVFLVSYKGLTKIVNDKFNLGDYKSYPMWNQIYIGINEAEFGFMDNDFSYDRDLEDVTSRIREYGPKRMTKILVKKTFWLWSQGTYQAERYAFGNNVVESEEKFEYETFLTKKLLNDEQPLRKLINAFMRSQYLVLFGMMIITLWLDKETKYKLLYYIIVATFLIMVIYELKSRYIISLLPFMLILACNSVDYFDIKKKGKTND